jgi:hypothetical protein
VRLGASAIHGIGVFAIKPIRAGTHLFADDRSGLVWVDKTAWHPRSDASTMISESHGATGSAARSASTT